MGTAPASPYYPPRARWYSSLWQLWYPLKRRLYLDRFHKTGQHEIGRVLLGMVLPGWGLLWSKRPILGVILGTTYCLSAAVFLIWVGYPISNFALTVMISIHAGSILRVEKSVGLRKRTLYSVLVFLAVAECVYVPLRNQIERHWFTPLRVRDRVVVVQTGTKHMNIHRGDWVAYGIGGLEDVHVHWEGVLVRGGCMLGRVMAVAGDEITFTSHGVLINGKSQPLLANMPTKGTVHVEQKCWFIWPEMSINIEGNVGAGIIEQAMMRLAKVPETNCVGVPYRRWFWQQQTLP